MKKNIPAHMDFTMVNPQTLVVHGFYEGPVTGVFRCLHSTVPIKGLMKAFRKAAKQQDLQPVEESRFYAMAEEDQIDQILRRKGFDPHEDCGDSSDDFDLQWLLDEIDDEATELTRVWEDGNFTATQWMLVIAMHLGEANEQAINCAVSGNLPGDCKKMRSCLLKTAAAALQALATFDEHGPDGRFVESVPGPVLLLPEPADSTPSLTAADGQ